MSHRKARRVRVPGAVRGFSPIATFQCRLSNGVRTDPVCISICAHVKTQTPAATPFLHDLKHIKARNCLLRIRLGVSQLRPHRLRFARNTEADLACPFCNNEIESEIHFILSCPMYNDLRDKYIPRKYVRCPSLFKLSMLFASENKYLQLRLATFLHKAFDVRDTVLSGQMLYL